MQVQVHVDIRAPRAAVWRVVTDIENAEKTIEGIEKVEVLERSDGEGVVGLKWRETRTMFGKEATEVMWITDAREPVFYDARAESHGAIYTTRVALDEMPEGTRLSMALTAAPQGMGAKIMSVVFGGVMKRSVRKALQKDLDDIKRAVESSAERS